MSRGCLAALLLAALALAGCGRETEPVLPSACRLGADAVRQALHDAPAEVRLQGTALSGCLIRASEPGDVLLVGEAFVGVASELSRRALAEPDGRAALELGYLVGAVRRGASRTQGIHDELVRRLEQELVLIDTATGAFRRGELAGRAAG